MAHTESDAPDMYIDTLDTSVCWSNPTAFAQVVSYTCVTDGMLAEEMRRRMVQDKAMDCGTAALEPISPMSQTLEVRCECKETSIVG